MKTESLEKVVNTLKKNKIEELVLYNMNDSKFIFSINGHPSISSIDIKSDDQETVVIYFKETVI